MKKIIIFTLGVFIIAGCSKQIQKKPSDSGSISESKKTEISDKNERTTGGLKPVRGTAIITFMGGDVNDWILKFPNGEYQIPYNLSVKYQISNLTVDVAYVMSNKIIPCKCPDPKHYVEIKSIYVISTQSN